MLPTGKASDLSNYLGGQFADRSGGLITFEARSVEDAEQLAADDPFVGGSHRDGRIGCVERGVHDRGSLPTDEWIDRREHSLEDWEVLIDALAGALARRGVANVDELRRGIESMPPAEYERVSYYERWLFSIETILTEKRVLAAGELDRRAAG
jgi:nitrile hydratase subunit beta